LVVLGLIIWTHAGYSGVRAGSTGSSSVTPGWFQNELTGNAGIAFLLERSFFNARTDISGNGKPGYGIAYLRSLDREVAVGVRISGTGRRIENFGLIVNGHRKVYTFDLVMMTYALEGRYTPLRGLCEPYCSILAFYAHGSLENGEYGRRSIEGFGGGVGVGTNLVWEEHWIIGIGVTYSFGKGSWNELPFTNSSSTAFDPSMVTAMMHLGFRWDD
jgi:hypothetical protein